MGRWGDASHICGGSSSSSWGRSRCVGEIVGGGGGVGKGGELRGDRSRRVLGTPLYNGQRLVRAAVFCEHNISLQADISLVNALQRSGMVIRRGRIGC